MLNDVRVGLRLLWKDKAFTVTAALTLALCIGANTALFSVVHNVLLRPLPCPDSDRILVMENIYPGAGADVGGAGVPDYYDRLRDTTVFEEQALYNGRNQSVDQNGTPTRIRGDERDAVLLPPAADAGADGPLVRSIGRGAGQREEGRPQLRAVAVAVRRRSAGSRQGHPPRRPAVHDRRRDAEGVLLPEPERHAVAAAGLHRGAEVRRAASQQQLSAHRPAEAGRDGRAGAAADRRAEHREPRSLSAIQGAADQRRLPHERVAPAGQPGARRQGDAVSDVGRRAVRAAHRLRQRREPRARAIARAAEGARDAARARRRDAGASRVSSSPRASC